MAAHLDPDFDIDNIPGLDFSLNDFPIRSNDVHDDEEVDAAMVDAGDELLYQQDPGYEFSQPTISPEQTYDFRPGDRFQPADEHGAYIDDDVTGDYDPTTRIYRPRRIGTRAAVERTEDEQAKFDADRAAGARVLRLEHDAARVNQVSLVVTFYTGGIGGTGDDRMKKLAEKFTNNWAPDTVPSNPVLSRIRPLLIEDDRRHLIWQHQAHIEDPAGEEIDLVHHPAARGCAGCRKLNLDCSLLDAGSEYTWPCRNCLHDGGFCELLTPPILRRSCESCNRKKILCSYVHDFQYNHKLPCERCLEAAERCEAGPAEDGGIRQRISLEKDSNNATQSMRKYIQCAACRKDGLPCSLKSRKDAPPCERCSELSRNCVFWRVTRFKSDDEKKKQLNKKRRAQEDHFTKEKSTALTHPVEFLSSSGRCSFCVKLNYGIIGNDGNWHSRILVPTDDKHTAFQEMQAGANKTDRKRGSTMCFKCSITRLQVHSCPGHEFEEIPGLIKTTIDLETDGIVQELQFDVGALFSRMQNNRMRKTDAWCSLCVAPAFYQCTASQAVDGEGTPDKVGGAEPDGCGLKLCDSCYHECCLQNDDLSAVLAKIRKVWNGRGTKDRWLFGPRADAGFLMEDGVFEDGLLVRNAVPQD